MLAPLRSRLTFANVASALALFVALSTGGAYAAHETIFSDDIVDGEVKNPDLGTDSVSTAKIQTQGVANSDLAPNSVTATRLATDSVETSEIKTGNVFNADIAGGTITSSRISDGTLTDADLGPGSVGTSEVNDFSLKDEDVGKHSLFHTEFAVGGVPAQSCETVITIGEIAVDEGDHLVLTPSSSDAHPSLSYEARYAANDADFDVVINACNPTASGVNDGNTHFSLLAIDAN